MIQYMALLYYTYSICPDHRERYPQAFRSRSKRYWKEANTPSITNERPVSDSGGGVARFTYIRGTSSTSFACDYMDGVDYRLQDLTTQTPEDKGGIQFMVMNWYEQTLELHVHDSSQTKASLAWWTGLDTLVAKVPWEILLQQDPVSFELDFFRVEISREFQWRRTRVSVKDVSQQFAVPIESLRTIMSPM
jgi:hypothetical protein